MTMKKKKKGNRALFIARATHSSWSSQNRPGIFPIYLAISLSLAIFPAIPPVLTAQEGPSPLPPSTSICTSNCDGCATSQELDDYVRFRDWQARSEISSPSRRSGPQRASALGGLVLVEDEGSFTDDNNGSVWDLEETTLVFDRDGNRGHFQASRTALHLDLPIGENVTSFEGVWGEHPLDLPFSFPFGNTEYTKIYITSDIGVFFRSQPVNEDGFQFGQSALFGTTPRITPLLRDSPWTWADKIDLYVKTTDSSVTVTWHEQTTRAESNPHLDRAFQVKLDQTGRIEISYPHAKSFNTFGAVQVYALGARQGQEIKDLSTLAETPTRYRFIRQAFTFPTLLPIAVRDFLQTRYGLDESNTDAIAIYQNHYTEITFYAGAYSANGFPGASGVGRDGPRATSLLHMNQIDLSWNRRSEGTMISVLNHEFGHKWLYFIDGVGSSRSGPHPAQSSHLPAAFSWLLDQDSSSMGGTTWLDNRDGTFTSPPEGTYYSYSWIELYLMGLASPSEVTPWWFVDDNETLRAPYFPPSGTTFPGTRRSLNVDDVIRANGPRTPAYPNAETHFRVAFVLLGRPENPLTGEDVANVRRKMFIWKKGWERSVGHRATLETELSEIVGTGPLDCNFNGIDDAEDIGSGRESDCNANGVPDRCESLPSIAVTSRQTTVRPGEIFTFEVVVENTSPTVQNVDSWVDIRKPDGSPFSGNPIAGPRTRTLTPGQTVMRTITVRVPRRAPAPSGPYTVRGSLGRFPTCTSTNHNLQFRIEP